MDIRDYLIQVGEEITRRPLPQFDNQPSFYEWRTERKQQFLNNTGIDRYMNEKRTPLNTQYHGVIQCEGFQIKKIVFESIPGLYVCGNLYIPDSLQKPAPAILYVCGHAELQKAHYQEHPRRFAQLGFVTLAIDTIQFGENHGVHHGTFSHGWFHWHSKGYSPVAIEVWNAIRAIDLMSELDEVDEGKIGMTGHSGGGVISWYTACVDDRIQVMASSSGTGTTASHIREGTIDTHCDCVYPSNPYGWSFIETYALAAPCKVLIVAPDGDRYYKIDAVRNVYGRLKELYHSLNVPEHLQMLEFHGPHAYSAESRKGIFHWFLKHLMGQDTRIEDMEDVDDYRLSAEQLSVFEGKPPANDRSSSVQDGFIPVFKPGSMDQTVEQFELERDHLLRNLKRESFFTFPSSTDSPEVSIEQQYEHKQREGFLFSFQSEKNWRLWGELSGRKGMLQKQSPTVVHLRAPGDVRATGHKLLLKGLGDEFLQARLDTRGTGYTAWGSELNWYLRRSFASTGRTIVSMRIWDTLQGIKAVRSMPEVDDSKIVLAAEEEMAVVALYAALLDGNISAVILKDPPATQNCASDANGLDNHLEIINALRYTDLPHVAGMLWPTKIVFVGNKPDFYHCIDRPENYGYTEDLYRKLGEPGGIWSVTSLADVQGLSHFV